MTNDSGKPLITPAMKVGDLLKHYPELEDALLKMSPAFAKLKNPILRKTVARVATLGQAAAIGNLKISELINELRKVAGFDESYEGADSIPEGKAKPQWLKDSKIYSAFDARPLIEKGEQPLTLVLQKLNKLEKGEILELLTPFYPAPMVDKARSIGFEVWSEKADYNLVRTYFLECN